MHIHTIRSGSKKQYRKRLLRVSYRVGQQVRKFSVADVTGWTADQMAILEVLLEAKRAVRGTAQEWDVDRHLMGLLYAHVPQEKTWRITGRPVEFPESRRLLRSPPGGN